MKSSLHTLIYGVIFWNSLHPGSLALEAPSGSGAWLWEKYDVLNDISFDYYFLHTGVYAEMALCVFQCLQIRECQSITVEAVTEEYKCRFHSRRFSYYESSYLGSAQQGLDHFRISSLCPTSDSHFFSREARMCVSVNVYNRKKQTARDYCVGLGGDLLTIDTEVKVTFIADVLVQVSSWTTRCFHTDAEATNGVYQWPDGTPVSNDLLNEPYDPAFQCVEIIYNGPGQLTGKVYDCSSKRIAVICQYPI